MLYNASMSNEDKAFHLGSTVMQATFNSPGLLPYEVDRAVYAHLEGYAAALNVNIPDLRLLEDDKFGFYSSIYSQLYAARGELSARCFDLGFWFLSYACLASGVQADANAPFGGRWKDGLREKAQLCGLDGSIFEPVFAIKDRPERERIEENGIALVVNEVSEAISKSLRKGRDARVKVLFIAASPTDTVRLRLGEEVREIDDAILRAKFRDRLELLSQWAVRVTDIQQHLLRHQPRILHFSGHGAPGGEIVLEDAIGNARRIPIPAVTAMMALFAESISGVILNACHTEDQAREIANSIDFVIGMSRAVGDKASIEFSRSFYTAIGHGSTVSAAFKLACAQIAIAGLGGDDTPRLICKSDFNPDEFAFFSR